MTLKEQTVAQKAKKYFKPCAYPLKRILNSIKSVVGRPLVAKHSQFHFFEPIMLIES